MRTAHRLRAWRACCALTAHRSRHPRAARHLAASSVAHALRALCGTAAAIVRSIALRTRNQSGGGVKAGRTCVLAGVGHGSLANNISTLSVAGLRRRGRCTRARMADKRRGAVPSVGHAAFCRDATRTSRLKRVRHASRRCCCAAHIAAGLLPAAGFWLAAASGIWPWHALARAPKTQATYRCPCGGGGISCAWTHRHYRRSSAAYALVATPAICFLQNAV